MTPTFHTLGLADSVVRGVVKAGYTTPTPIQAEAIPIALDGRDLTGCAQTGTGKTASFVLPLLHRLAEGDAASTKRRPVRALVLTPTRELAIQVEESVRSYGRFTGLRSAAVYGGVGMGGQLSAFRRGIDVVVATPGRLLDHLGRGSLDLSFVDVLVLDEADRMLDMGFIHDIRKVVARIPKERQTMLFSATMPPAIQKLAQSVQRRPAFVEVGERTNPAETVTQHVYPVRNEHKMDLLLHVLRTEDVDNVLVFSRTKHRADRITKKLGRAGVAAVAIHSNRSQNQRQRALEGFRDGTYSVMVATDIAARGIDVDGISHVINYDTPNQAEDYIHRIGRTGRAQASGDALTFFSSDEEDYLRSIESHTGQRFAREPYPGFTTDTPVRPVGQTNGAGGRGGNARGGSSRSGNGGSGQGSSNRKRSSRRRRR